MNIRTLRYNYTATALIRDLRDSVIVYRIPNRMNSDLFDEGNYVEWAVSFSGTTYSRSGDRALVEDYHLKVIEKLIRKVAAKRKLKVYSLEAWPGHGYACILSVHSRLEGYSGLGVYIGISKL